MELKLEQNESGHILIVKGDVSARDSHVIRAGISKIAENGSEGVLLQVNEAKLVPESRFAIYDLFLFLTRKEIPLVVVGFNQDLCVTAKFDEGLELLHDEAERDKRSSRIYQSMDNYLSEKLEQFQAKLEKLEEDGALGVLEGKIRQLHDRVSGSEKFLENYLETRTEFEPDVRLMGELAQAEKDAFAVLTKHGLHDAKSG